MTAGLELGEMKDDPVAVAIQNSKNRSKQLCGSVTRIWEPNGLPLSGLL